MAHACLNHCSTFSATSSTVKLSSGFVVFACQPGHRNCISYFGLHRSVVNDFSSCITLQFHLHLLSHGWQVKSFCHLDWIIPNVSSKLCSYACAQVVR